LRDHVRRETGRPGAGKKPSAARMMRMLFGIAAWGEGSRRNRKSQACAGQQIVRRIFSLIRRRGAWFDARIST
jgi:hypothetical protein